MANDLFAAQSIRIELPLSDGSTNAVEISPQDPVFKAFGQECVSKLRDAAAAEEAHRKAAAKQAAADALAKEKASWPGRIERAVASDSVLLLRISRQTEGRLVDLSGHVTGIYRLRACQQAQLWRRADWSIWKKTPYPNVPAGYALVLSSGKDMLVAKSDLIPMVSFARPAIVCGADGIARLASP